ncbi:hypothetical protein T03_15738 [Trichinella britovi]|uniref:Uncharacterized protein n=1 Tax=Trichinella britovi TaxID=45882 RepID=A0A0V1ARL7_TRIBR|nr:hypothetical protein T03_15738 [Trichinella britovi]
MPPPAKQMPRIFQRWCRPVTQCITAVRRDTHDFHLNNRAVSMIRWCRTDFTGNYVYFSATEKSKRMK